MIFVTTAPNDADLLEILEDNAIGVPLPYGDATFQGVWDGGEVVNVCIERKKLGDLATCIVSTGRHLNQIRSAREAGFGFIVLVFEMDAWRFRIGENGYMETRVGKEWVEMMPRISYVRLDQYLNELGYFMGVLVKRSGGVWETARQILDLYQLFAVEPQKHGSLKKFYTPQVSVECVSLLAKPSLVRRVANQLPGVGWELSRGVEVRFRNVEEMAEGGVKDWMDVDGIGKVMAKRIVRVIRGGK